jgi:hypothetical protein
VVTYPNHLSILINATITREESHARHTRDGLRQPLVLLLVGIVNQFLRINVRFEVVRDQVVIAVIDDRVHESRELAGIAEDSLADRGEDALEHGVEVEVLVVVGVAEVFNVFAEVAEEEDVFFADFSGDLGGFC